MGVCVYNSKVFFVMIFLRLSVWVCLGKKKYKYKIFASYKNNNKKKTNTFEINDSRGWLQAWLFVWCVLMFDSQLKSNVSRARSAS